MHRWNSKRWWAVFCCAVGLIVHSVSCNIWADEGSQVTLGWNGVVTVGRWNMAAVTFSLAENVEYQVEVSAYDAQGHTAVFHSNPISASGLTPGTKGILQAAFVPGRIESPLTVRLLANDHPQESWTITPGRDVTELTPADRQIVLIGQPRGFEELALAPVGTVSRRLQITTITDVLQLPRDVLAYDAIDTVVITGHSGIAAEQMQTLNTWVRSGGRLIVSWPRDWQKGPADPVRAALPVTVGAEATAVRELGSLEAFAGRNIRIPLTGRLPLPVLSSEEGIPLAGTRELPYLLRIPHGLGEMIVVAVDLTQPPMSTWSGLRDFIAKLIDAETAVIADTQPVSAAGRLTSSGVTDFATQVLAGQDYFPDLPRSTPGTVMVWLLLYLLLVGPLDYGLVHYVLRRPVWTWVTVTLSILGFGYLATQLGLAQLPLTARSKQLEVLDIDAETGGVEGRGWITEYAPKTVRADWQATVAASAPATSSVPLLFPFAAPEAAFGGMYRAPGSEWGRTTYQVEPGRILGLPVLSGSTSTIAARWSIAGDANQLPVTVDLRSSGLGRLTGSITHHLPGEILDGWLAFANRAYRWQPSRDDETSVPWLPETPFSTEHPDVYQRELRGALTRAVVMVEKRSGHVGNEVRETQTEYDPSGRDPLVMWQVLTLHSAAGGMKYTGLTNTLLADADLTRQLDAGRAIFFGRLNTAPRLGFARNGETVTPDETTVLVRMVLPVRKSGSIPRVLPKLNEPKDQSADAEKPSTNSAPQE